MTGFPPGTTHTCCGPTFTPRVRETYAAIDSRSSGSPCVGPYLVQPSSSARFPASTTCLGVGKSGSPISRWMTLLPCFSRALALTRTSKADSTPMRDIASTSCMLLVGSRCRLHQGGRPPAPGSAFVLGNSLDVLHIGRGLRQDVMQ